jgi:two-component system, OmpR family, phosphate regulon sensor histidine kinase PhoR
MPERPDYAALVAGHTIVIEMINSGEAGLPALNYLLRVAQRALGAAGMSFAEYRTTGGRIIAATGGVEWALGHPMDVADPTTAGLLSGRRTDEVRADEISGDLARQVSGRGLGRMIVARAEVGGLLVGTLHAYYPDGDDRAGAEHHRVISYLASCIAHTYGDQAGLPVHGDTQAPGPLAAGLAIVDGNGLIRVWNPAAEQVTGQPAGQMLNRPLPFPAPPLGQVIDHVLPDGRSLKITSGELPGSVAWRVITFRDATDQGRDHDRELFVAVTSHELRTPVTVIKGYADTLSKHWDSLTEPDRRDAARVIGQRADDLARLVDRLLSAANDSGPVGASSPVPIDLADALRIATAALPADLRARLALDLPDNLPKVLGDPASLATVLTELATNAHKYSPARTLIEVTAGADERTVAFRVSDRGIGVRPDQVERAFDRFWQGESGDRRRYPGAGLGLYLVRRIVERQNGWVSLRPREAGGTVAEVRLPRA